MNANGTKTAVMIGAGNIGRGFVGAAFAASGYETVFIDADERLVAEIGARGEYPVRLLLPDGGRPETIIRNVRAVNGNDTEEAARAIAHADLCGVSVGARALPQIAPLLAAGLAARVRENTGPLDTIVCENLIDAGGRLRELVLAAAPAEISPEIDRIAGFPEAVIGRMVPIQTDEMKDGDPLRICAEKYAFLPVDKAAFKGMIPPVEGMVPFDGFGYYVKRKLFLHNLGHAAVAYLGLLKGYTHIADAVDDADILFLTTGAMHESAVALGLENRGDEANLECHIDSLLYRFANRALEDTCARVAADPVRKLGREDRLIGALLNCEAYGLPTVYIAAVAAAAAEVLERTWEGDGTSPPLSEITGLSADSESFATILALCAAIASPSGSPLRFASVAALRRTAMKLAGDITIL